MYFNFCYRITVQRNILRTSSKYFCAMFASGMIESEQKEIRLKNISGEALRLITDYCYNGEIEINTNNIETLLPAASQLEFVEIETECSKFLEDSLKQEPLNCLSHYLTAYTFNFCKLRSMAMQFMYDNFEKIKDTEDFLLLDIDGLFKLVRNDELKAEREDNVFTAVMSWINHNEKNRKQHLVNLLKNIRYTYMDATVKCCFLKI